MHPNPESYGMGRRPMDVDDYFDIIRRHRGWILGPAFAGLVISVVVAFLWPDTYVSDATIRIVPPAVPERLVPSNVNLQIGQRIAAMEQQVRSRTNVLNLINQNGLYPRKKGRIPDEDLVEQMQKDVSIVPVIALREASEGRALSTAFRVSFAYENRYLAQKVVSQIVGMFLDETVRTRSTESVMTTEFLKEKLEAAKNNLEAIENRLTQYKLQFAGKLPEQLNSNLGQLNALQSQLASAGSSINRATQEKLLLENSLRTIKEQFQAAPATASASVEAAVKSDRIIQLDRQILALETAVAGMRQQYSDSHPDVRRARSQLASLKSSRESLMREEEKASEVAQPAKAAPVAESREQKLLQAEIARVQGLIESKDVEIQNLVKEQARLDKAIKVYQDRIEASPFGEREYALMTRDYGIAKQQYEDLVLKSSQSSMATDLETRKQGETLEVLEQASLPQTPTEPNRWLVVAVGTFIGASLGLFLAGGREMRDTSLKNLKDVRAYTGLPVLGSVPLVENDLLVQRKRRLTWVAWSGACIVGFLLMLGSVYYYFTKSA
jgi:polysaccharide chain length determinant protein (PEP-CTERM system associated)